MEGYPYVIINTATSIDGKISTPNRQQTILSNNEDFEIVDKIRSEVDAILIGHTTLIQDDPRLTVKNETYIEERIQQNKSPQPMKVVISPDCKIPLTSNFLQDGDSEKLIFTTQEAHSEDIQTRLPFANVSKHDSSRVNILKLAKELYKNGVKKLLVEGGGGINFSFIQSGLVDEIRVAISNCIIGGSNSPSLADGFGFDNEDIKQFELVNVDVLHQVIIANYRSIK